MKITTLLLALLLLFSTSCSKKDDEGFKPILPPITQTGENTFGCYAGEVLITPRDGTGTFNVPDPGISFIAGPGAGDINYYEISVHDFASEKTSQILLHIAELDNISVGEYPIKQSNCQGNLDGPTSNHVFCRIWDYDEKIYKYYCSIENSGVIFITRYDVENRIISGLFNCKAVNSVDPNDVIEITEGRFDLKWDELPYTNFP